MDLSEIKCVPCQGGEPPLGKVDIENYLKEVDPEWKLKDGPDRIVRKFIMKNFMDAVSFLNKTAELAESEGHHPNLRILNYKELEVELFTHKIAGLHKNDFLVAAKIDKLYREIKTDAETIADPENL